MKRGHSTIRSSRTGTRTLSAAGAWAVACLFGAGIAQGAAKPAPTTTAEASVQSLLAADEATIASLVKGAAGHDKLIPRTLPKTPKWQGRLSELQDVPNPNGIQVRVAVPASRQRVTLGSAPLDFEMPANVMAGGLGKGKDKQAAASEGCLGPCPSASAKALDKDLVAAIPKTAVEAPPETGPALTINVSPDRVELTPKRVALAKAGERWTVRVKGVAFDHGTGVNVFVRDAKVIRWHGEARTIEAMAPGRTELYVVAGGQMQIVPVEVGGGAATQTGPALSVASSLLSLNNVLTPSVGQASRVQVASLEASLPSYYDQARGLGDAAASDDQTAANDEVASNDEVAANDEAESAPEAPQFTEVGQARVAAANRAAKKDAGDLGVAEDIQVFAYQGARKVQANLGKMNPLSLRDSAIEAIKTQELAKAQSAFVRAKRKAEYKTISFQVIDERSIPERGVVYPVAGAQVRIIGTEFVATTNATGHVVVSDVPADARIMVAVDDSRGTVLPTTTEVSVKALAPNEVTRVKVLSYKSHDLYANVFGVVPVADQASYCARLVPTADRPDVANLNVRVQGGAEGPYYFSSFGPSPTQTLTGADGRFCFFNVNPGLFEISVYEGEEPLTSVVVPMFAGRHGEDEISIADGPEIQTRLAAQATAKEQIFGDRLSANNLQAVDAVDMVVVGENEKLGYVDSGLMNLAAGATFHHGRKYVMANAAEFEPVLYGYDEEDSDQRVVTPLLPRGFVEEVYNELYMEGSGNGAAYDPSLGALVVNHGALEGQGRQAINIKLVDQAGREVEGGWYFGAEGDEVTKAVFFNLEPGMYTVIVESENNYWLAVDTVAVDNWSTSYVATGSKMGFAGAATLSHH